MTRDDRTQGLAYLREVAKQIVRAAGFRDELSFTSFRHGGFTEGADSDLTDAKLRAAVPHYAPSFVFSVFSRPSISTTKPDVGN